MIQIMRGIGTNRFDRCGWFQSRFAEWALVAAIYRYAVEHALVQLAVWKLTED